jgi:hypothetical protein
MLFESHSLILTPNPHLCASVETVNNLALDLRACAHHNRTLNRAERVQKHSPSPDQFAYKGGETPAYVAALIVESAARSSDCRSTADKSSMRRRSASVFALYLRGLANSTTLL